MLNLMVSKAIIFLKTLTKGQLKCRGLQHVSTSPQTYILSYLCDSEIFAFWPKKAILNVWGYIYVRLYMGCGYPTVDINYANYICVISVSLT